MSSAIIVALRYANPAPGSIRTSVFGATATGSSKNGSADDCNPHVVDVDWLAQGVAALAERWSRQPAVKRRRTA